MKNPDQKFSRFSHSMNRFCALILSIGLMSFAACFPQAEKEKESESEGEVIRSNESDSDSNIDSKSATGAGAEKEKSEGSDTPTGDGSKNDSKGSQESEKPGDQKTEVAQEEGKVVLVAAELTPEAVTFLPRARVLAACSLIFCVACVAHKGRRSVQEH